MYRHIGASELHSLNIGLKNMICAKKFTYDKDFISFMHSELEISNSIDYYFRLIKNTHYPCDTDLLILNILKINNFLSLSDLNFIKSNTVYGTYIDDFYDDAQDNCIQILEFLLGFWNKLTNTKAIMWDLESIGISEDCEDIEAFFRNIKKSIQDYICFDEYLEAKKEDELGVNYYEWFQSYAGENGNVYCFPNLKVEDAILLKINKLLPNACCQISTEAWCENNNFYITIADSSLIEGLNIRLIALLLVLMCKEAINV